MCLTPLLSALPQGPCCGPSVGDVVLGLVPWPVWLQFVPPLQRAISDTVLSLSPTHSLCGSQPAHTQTHTICFIVGSKSVSALIFHDLIGFKDWVDMRSIMSLFSGIVPFLGAISTG